MLATKVRNLSKDARKYVVAKVVFNELWYWNSWDTEEDAKQSAEDYGDNAIVLEVVNE